MGYINANDILPMELIVDASEKKSMGVIWYLFEMADDIKQVFLSDFIFKKEECRKGYASVALTEMERDAQRNGCAESILYVWKHIHRGATYIPKAGMLHLRNWMMECTGRQE